MFPPKYFYGRYYRQTYWPPSGVNNESRYQRMSDLAAARKLVLPITRVNYVMIQAEGQNVRYRDDGIAPTATSGLLIYAGEPPRKFAGSIAHLQFIQQSTGAILNVSYH